MRSWGDTAGAEKTTADSVETVDICICTYRRAHLSDTLHSVIAQTLPPGLACRVIVADNDAEPSARQLVEGLAETAPFPVTYIHAPQRNISIARNACLDQATGDWLAFIDDDETAPKDWIATLWQFARSSGCDVVFGPVIAIYPDETPGWIRKGDYHSSYAHVHSGTVRTGHSGNVLMRWQGSPISNERFLLGHGRTGGEDVEFFFRLSRAGCHLGIEEVAKLYEEVPPDRLSYRWLRQRRFTSGQSYGACFSPKGDTIMERLILLAGGGTKTVFCLICALAFAWSKHHRNRWALRGWFHAGFCAAVLGIRQAERY